MNGNVMGNTVRMKNEEASCYNHTVADITRLAHNTSVRVARFLARVGLIEADAENSYLSACGYWQLVSIINNG